MHEMRSFSIPAVRDVVPEKVKPWIILVFVIIFQFSGGIYLAVMGEMVGSLSLMQEDITMAGYASMVGMALTFTIMFRLKVRFTSKVALFTCAIAIIFCNLICMYTHNVLLLIGTCFLAGFFRMWATFECNSTIQLWITPRRDLSVFFCFIYLLVQGCIQLSGLTTVYIAFFSEWRYMHWLVIGLLTCVMLLTLLLFRDSRTFRKLPLYGIDWLGALLWGLIVLSIIFVCVYGDHYDWFASGPIRLATIGGIVLIVLNIWRASFIRHPFIALTTWRFKTVYLTFLIYILLNLLLAPVHLFEHVYMESILGYDSLHVFSLQWVTFGGILTGSFFSYQTFARRKWSYRIMTVIGFISIVGYLLLFYFIIDYHIPKTFLILPIFFRSFGYVIISICFVTALSRIPFQNFPQSLSIQAFASACFGGALGTALLGEVLKVVMKRNIVFWGTELDHVNPLLRQIPLGEVYGVLQQQALIVSMKEVYGWLTLLGILCLLLFMIRESDIRPQYVIHPPYRAIRKWVKRELREKDNEL